MSTLCPADFFVLRTPALSWDVVRAWTEGLGSAAAYWSGGDLEEAVHTDERLLRARLRQIANAAEVREAIYVASPSLHARLQPWLDGDESDKSLSVEAATVRYLLRMAGRPTPFGLFAGYSVGVAAGRSELVAPSRSAYTRRSRLNLDVMYAIAARLAARPELRAHLSYRSNTSIYRVGERLRYHAVRLDERSSSLDRRYSVRELAVSPHIDAALAAGRAAGGATIADLAEAIVCACDGVELDDAVAYVERLVDERLFSPSLLPPITGGDACEHVIAELRRLPSGEEPAAQLESIVAELAALDASPDGDRTAPTRCARIARTVAACGVETELSGLLKVDLRQPRAAGTLDRRILREICVGVETLASLAADKPSPIRTFARAFEDRYQGRQVALLDALDPEVGVGFEVDPDGDASALIKGLPFAGGDPRSVPWNEREALLLDKVMHAARTGAIEIELSPSDLATLSHPMARTAPAGQTAIATIAARSVAALERGEYRLHLAGASQSTSAALLGRFLHDDDVLHAHVRSALRREEAHDADAVHAEIAHHLGIGPMKGATNISRRPVLREYEIDVADASGAPPDKRITLDDLLVSVRDGKVVLRSRRLGRRVVPHLSTAHAFSGPGLSIYRFLAHLQTQEVNANVSWCWGPALAQSPFLPRVVRGRLVFALATWRLTASALSEVYTTRGAARFRALMKLRADLRIPRHVCLVEGDNLLPVDLESVVSIESMISACKGASMVVLRERFPDADELVVRGADGAFCHELFVPLLRAPAPSPSPVRTLVEPSRAMAGAERRALPGSEWLFAKVYAGPATCDRFLTEVVVPLVQELRVAGLIDGWFFMRYMDPDRHLRIRFRGNPRMIWTEVAPRFFAAASSMRSQIHKLVIDTYDLEVERYGGERGVELSHRIFEADSDAALGIVRLFRNDANARWRMALVSIDALLDDLGLTLSQKRELVSDAREHWGRHFGGGTELTRKIGDSFRRMRGDIEALIAHAPSGYDPAVAMVRARSAVLARVAPQLQALDRDGELSVPLPRIAQSYVHMLVNRLLRGAANKHELVLYHFLCRVYDAALARGRRHVVGCALPAAAVAPAAVLAG